MSDSNSSPYENLALGLGHNRKPSLLLLLVYASVLTEKFTIKMQRKLEKKKNYWKRNFLKTRIR